MNELIQRYIYDVTRRLPEKDRKDIRLELESNISDMLPETPSEQDVMVCLTKLGAPRLLAEQYRSKPRYLISPAMYDSYITVLRLVASIVAGICFYVGLVQSLTSGSVGDIIGNAVSMAIEGTLQAALWVTIGFVIADRVGVKPDAWTPADLPALPDLKAVIIKRSSTIIEIVMTVFFGGLFIITILRDEWFFVIAHEAELISPFTQDALHRFIPYMIITVCLSFIVYGCKLFWARWTLPLCVINAVNNIIWASIMVYVLRWPDLWSDEFFGLVESLIADTGYLIKPGLTAFFISIMILIAVMDTASGVWNTVKGLRNTAK